MNLDTAINEVRMIADELISSLRQVKPEELGLDPRAGYTMYATEGAVAVRTYDIRSLNYYGGFEYVDAESIKVIGDYTFFMADDSRIQECLDCLEDNED